MIHKKETKQIGLVFASIIGLVFALNVVLSAAVVLINYPTEAHRSVYRQLDALNSSMWSGSDFTVVMDSDEYKRLSGSPEANYTNIATTVTLLVNSVVSIAIIGGVYHYLRKHRITKRPVGATVLLVTLGGLVPLVLTAFAAAAYIGTPTPGVGHVVFMLFIGLVIAPLVIALIARIFQWYYNRKHSFVIE
jgi:hypothetical protein